MLSIDRLNCRFCSSQTYCAFRSQVIHGATEAPAVLSRSAVHVALIAVQKPSCGALNVAARDGLLKSRMPPTRFMVPRMLNGPSAQFRLNAPFTCGSDVGPRSPT